MLYLLGFFILLTSCSSESPSSAKYTVQEINGRDQGVAPLVRIPIYRAKVPQHWNRTDPVASESIFDTRKSLVEFFITEAAETIRITIHNFPVENSKKIPLIVQVARWQRQFAMLEPTKTHVEQQSWGGFVGLYFEGTGQIGEKSMTVMAWAMQMALEHDSTLRTTSGNEEKHKQISADYTIKASGAPHMMKKYQSEIAQFAHSFELIHGIPLSS